MGKKGIAGFLLGGLFLIGISGLPALLELSHDGWQAPVSIPFGVTADDVRKGSTPVVWVDARSHEAFDAAHIPGALELNRDNWEVALPHFMERYSPGKVVIVYCSADCTESEEVANRIRNLGLEPVEVLEGGFEAWQKGSSGE